MPATNSRMTGGFGAAIVRGIPGGAGFGAQVRPTFDPWQALVNTGKKLTGAAGNVAKDVTTPVDPALLAYLRQVQANETQINAAAQSNIDAINSGLSANVRGALMQTADNLRQSQSQAVLAGNRRSGRYEEKVARQRAAGMDQINSYQAQAASQISAASANAAQQIANLRMQAGEQRLASQQRNQQMGLYRPENQQQSQPRRSHGGYF